MCTIHVLPLITLAFLSSLPASRTRVSINTRLHFATDNETNFEQRARHRWLITLVIEHREILPRRQCLRARACRVSRPVECELKFSQTGTSSIIAFLLCIIVSLVFPLHKRYKNPPISKDLNIHVRANTAFCFILFVVFVSFSAVFCYYLSAVRQERSTWVLPLSATRYTVQLLRGMRAFSWIEKRILPGPSGSAELAGRHRVSRRRMMMMMMIAVAVMTSRTTTLRRAAVVRVRHVLATLHLMRDRVTERTWTAFPIALDIAVLKQTRTSDSILSHYHLYNIIDPSARPTTLYSSSEECDRGFRETKKQTSHCFSFL